MHEIPDWLSFDIDDIREQRAEHGRPWQEFIRVPNRYADCMGSPRETRTRRARTRYRRGLLRARGRSVVPGRRPAHGRPARIGPFVAKGKNHRFVDIAEDLSVLFFFATPGGSTT